MRCQRPSLVVVFLLSLSLPTWLHAQQFCAYRMRLHATNCQLLTDGDLCDLCYEQDSSRLWKCEPSVAGETCSGAEWKEVVFAITDAAVPDTITASNYLRLDGGTLTGQVITSNLGIELTESDTNPPCSAGNYTIFADLSETTLKTCMNGVSAVLGGGVSGVIPAAAAPVVDAAGEIALDTDVWGNGHGGLIFYDGLVAQKSVALPVSTSCAEGNIPKFDADTSTWACTADDIGATFPTGDDAQLAYLPATSGESAWYTGINNDSTGDADDCFEFRTNSAPGTAVILSLCPDGTVSTPASALTGFQLEMFEDSDLGTGSILFGVSGDIANVQKDCRFDASGQMPANCIAGGGSLAFSSLTTGTNTTATMTVGSGASLVPTGTGIITATGAPSGFTLATTTCLSVSADRIYHDTDCDNTKDAGEEFIDQTGGGSSAFNAITSGTNTTATMTVGTGATLVPSGTGVITATSGASGFTVGTVSDPADTGGVNFDNATNGPCWEASPTGADVCLIVNATEQLSVTGGTLDISAAKVSGTVAKSLYLRADAFYTQGNCVLFTDTAPISGGLVHPYITCADTTGDNFHTNFLMPDCWDGGTVTVEAMAWISTATGTTTLNWSGESVADNETVGTDISDTGGQNTTFTHTNYAANDEAHVTSPAITVNGAGPGEHLYLEGRTTAFTAGFKFGGAKLEYLCNQSGD